MTVLGTPVDLSKITVDTYVVAGIADHITPWQNAYRSAHLLGSDPRFVLSTSGHIAALVNPPGNEKASYRSTTGCPRSPRRGSRSANQTPGTWWDGLDRVARRALGRAAHAPASGSAARAHQPLGEAPGSYVREEKACRACRSTAARLYYERGGRGDRCC